MYAIDSPTPTLTIPQANNEMTFLIRLFIIALFDALRDRLSSFRRIGVIGGKLLLCEEREDTFLDVCWSLDYISSSNFLSGVPHPGDINGRQISIFEKIIYMNQLSNVLHD